jgi:hypothetical protein
MRTVDLVVTRHVAFGLGELLGDAEWLEVDFTKSSDRDDTVISESLEFLFIADVVLDGCSDFLTLNTLHICCCQMTAQVGIFAEAFKSTTTKRTSLDVHGWTEQDMGTLVVAFLTKHVTYLAREIDIERRTETGTAWEAGGGSAIKELVACRGVQRI